MIYGKITLEDWRTVCVEGEEPESSFESYNLRLFFFGTLYNRDTLHKRFYYLPETFVFDEKIQNTDDFSRQRRRWLSAQWHYCQTFAKFLWKALAARNWDFCDKLFQQLSIPRLLLMGFTFFFSVLFTIYRWTWGLKWWLLLVLLAVALLVAVPKRFCTSRLAMALQKIPYTFLLMAGNIFKLRGANKSFIHTKHGVVEK